MSPAPELPFLPGSGPDGAPVAVRLPAVRVVISACLLGMNVRYDGGHKAWPWAAELARAGVIFIPVCPEAGCGLGVPREPMHLEGFPEDPTAITLTSRIDHSRLLRSWSVERLDALASLGVHGILLKSRSPSCGLMEVPVHDDQGQPIRGGTGLFARACRERFPGLPIEEGDLLTDRETVFSFLERVRQVAGARAW